jgi:hypothetical protein
MPLPNGCVCTCDGEINVTSRLVHRGYLPRPLIKRNLLVTEPYFHDGSQTTLWEVVELYNQGGIRNPFLDREIVPLGLNGFPPVLCPMLLLLTQAQGSKEDRWKTLPGWRAWSGKGATRFISSSRAWRWATPSARSTPGTAPVLEHWREFGLPAYAQFDNDTIFQGSHHGEDSLGRVIRICLQLGVTPVFAPPREPGLQAAIENFNGRWQAKVWSRFHHRSLGALQAQSRRYIRAYRQRAAVRIADAPGAVASPAPGNPIFKPILKGW